MPDTGEIDKKIIGVKVCLPAISPKLIYATRSPSAGSPFVKKMRVSIKITPSWTARPRLQQAKSNRALRGVFTPLFSIPAPKG